MNIQVMDALGIKKAFVLGTSQGGWVTVRMALIAPDKVGLQLYEIFCAIITLNIVQIEGIIPLGTSMDYESKRAQELGCWDGVQACTGSINEWTTTASTPDFEPTDAFANFLVDQGFGKDCDQSLREFWVKTMKSNYKGDDGRKRARMAAINLRDRDGLHGRLFDVTCPVLWLHVS